MGPKEDLKRPLNALKEGWQMTYLGSREGSKRGPLRGHVKLGSEGKGLQKGVQKWGQYQGISWHTGHQTMGSLWGPIMGLPRGVPHNETFWGMDMATKCPKRGLADDLFGVSGGVQKRTSPGTC